MKTVKQFLSSSVDREDITENIRNRSSRAIRNIFNITYQKIQRTNDIPSLLKLHAELTQLTIELLLKENNHVK